MNYDDSPEEAAFRRQLREWLEENGAPLPDTDDEDERRRARLEWHRRLHKAGYVGLGLPTEYGGRGLAAVYEAILNDEIGRAGAAKPPASVGYMARAIGLYGSDVQKRRFLPGLIDGSAQWCQGFSEPDAGSDLAGLRTVAIRDGDDYVVNGQKIWNGFAVTADWCYLLCRTNPELPKHKGISLLLVDMSTAGIEARPIRKISGHPDFSEIFFTDARVPVESLLGSEGQGWSVAMSTLGWERAPADIGNVADYRRTLTELDEARRHGRLAGGATTDLLLARANLAVEVLERHVQRSLSARAEDAAPGPEGSIDKLLMIRTEQELLHIATDLVGPGVWTGSEPHLQESYFWSWAASIYGGTEQIQKNIVATRVLGLPR